MKSTSEKVNDILQAVEDVSNGNLKQLTDLIEDYKKQGLLKTPTYTLPLPDTIGKGYYNSMNKRSS